jgi:3D (Asp-Asp-Asp) domain-containing protein
MKNTLIIILILILVLISFLLFLKVNSDYQQIEEMKGEQLNVEKRYLDNLSELTAGYNQLQSDYDKLLTEQEGKNVVWQTFEITAYTSQECGDITFIGIDLKANYAKYLNICAVDPSKIPLGSTVLIEFSDGTIKPYLACDTGSAIKGNRIDIYMTDRQEALNFGRQSLNVVVVK